MKPFKNNFGFGLEQLDSKQLQQSSGFNPHFLHLPLYFFNFFLLITYSQIVVEIVMGGWVEQTCNIGVPFDPSVEP